MRPVILVALLFLTFTALSYGTASNDETESDVMENEEPDELDDAVDLTEEDELEGKKDEPYAEFMGLRRRRSRRRRRTIAGKKDEPYAEFMGLRRRRSRRRRRTIG